MYLYDDEVRRADLNLRIQYPELNTEIYKKDVWEYIIFCRGYAGDFEKLKKEFDYSIRMAACPVRLSREKPLCYLEMIQPISMDNPVAEFRASVFTENDVKNFVESRFPDVEIKKITHKPGAAYSVDLIVGIETPEERMKEIERILSRCLSTDALKVYRDETGRTAESAQEEESDTQKAGSCAGAAAKRSLSFHRDMQWESEEADYWFTHAEEIYINEHTDRFDDNRRKIPYFRAEQKNCFMDCSVFDAPLDIRQILVLYDTIYLGMPGKKGQDRFFQGQDMTPKELMTLISMGKVVLVITGEETDYDVKFLNEVYRENPLGIIGRRAANTLVAAYFSELQWRYTKNYPDIYECTRELYRIGHKEENRSLVALADAVIYPIRAKAESFNYLNTDGLMSLPIFGVNRVYESVFREQISKKENDNLMLNFMVSAYPIHLAEALNAAYIPCRKKIGKEIYSDFYLAEMQESLLMRYWYCDFQIEKIKGSRLTQGLDQLELFEAEKGLSVIDIAESADQWNTPYSFGTIIQGLSDLPVEKQNEKIREYNHLLLEIAKQPDKKSVMEMMLAGAGYIPAGDILSTCVDLINLMLEFADAREYMKSYREKKQYEKKLKKVKGNAADKKALLEDVYVLDKIHRVVRLTPIR